MSEVNATGMLLHHPGVCSGVLILQLHLLGVLHIGVGKHSSRSPTGFSQDLRSKRAEMWGPRFLLCILNLLKNQSFRAPNGTILFNMKKLLVMALSMFVLVGSVNAQINDDIQKSKERAEKLQSLCNGYKTSGNANVDGFGDAIKSAAILAIANSEQLENLYKRQIGETKNGVTDVTITKPTLDEWIALSTTIAGEALSIKTATDKLQAASEEAKEIAENASKERNPMKAVKVAKKAKAATAVMEFGNTATPILIEESAAQAKAVKEIIETLKSGGNL